MTDQELVLETLEKPDAFSGIIEKYEERITRYVKRFLYVSTEDAEDIVQDIFVSAYRFLRSYKAMFSFSSWLYRIAHNQCVNYLRKHANRIAKEAYSLDSDEDWLESLISDSDTELSAMNEMAHEQIMVSIERLDAISRSVILLRFLEEKEYGEIADILKTSEGNVASLLYRAKNKLKGIVENERAK